MSNDTKFNSLELVGKLFIGNDDELYIKTEKECISVAEEICRKLDRINEIGYKPTVKINISIVND